MKVAIERLKMYKQLIGPMVLHVDSNREYTSIIINCLYTDNPLPDSLAAMELVFIVHLFRLATREQIRPLLVSGAASMLKDKQYTEYFGIKPQYGTGNELRFSSRDMLRPFLSENKKMWKFFEPELNKRLSDIGSGASFSEKVRSCLFELLPGGLCSVEDVADKLAVSKRTLQRYLSEENTSFQKELNTTREKLAKHYLKNQELSGSQISFLLGFNDPNSFVRAFHSWTGETPGKARKRILTTA
jgi:AraC-like DNA-binding protein